MAALALRALRGRLLRAAPRRAGRGLGTAVSGAGRGGRGPVAVPAVSLYPCIPVSQHRVPMSLLCPRIPSPLPIPVSPHLWISTSLHPVPVSPCPHIPSPHLCVPVTHPRVPVSLHLIPTCLSPHIPASYLHVPIFHVPSPRPSIPYACPYIPSLITPPSPHIPTSHPLPPGPLPTSLSPTPHPSATQRAVCGAMPGPFLGRWVLGRGADRG